MFVLTRLLQPLKRVGIEGIAEEDKADVYSKKITLRTHVYLLTIAFAFGEFTLEGISLISRHPRMERYQVPSVSKSQLSKLHNNDKPNRPKTTTKPRGSLSFQKVYQQLLKLTLHSLNIHSGRSKYLLHALDGSKKRGKVKFSKSNVISEVIEVDGVKLHLSIIPGLRKLPLIAIGTEPTVHDNTQFRTIIEQATQFVDLVGGNAITLFDLGYYKFEQFEEMVDKGILFISRVKKNAAHKVTHTSSKSPKAIDQMVKLDGCKHELRLVTLKGEDGEEWRYYTNVHFLTRQEIGTFYGYRWDVEIAHRDMNQVLGLKRFFGQSFNAVMIQIFMVLILWLLLIIFAERMGLDYTLSGLKRLVHVYHDIACSQLDYRPCWRVN